MLLVCCCWDMCLCMAVATWHHLFIHQVPDPISILSSLLDPQTFRLDRQTGWFDLEFGVLVGVGLCSLLTLCLPPFPSLPALPPCPPHPPTLPLPPCPCPYTPPHFTENRRQWNRVGASTLPSLPPWWEGEGNRAGKKTRIKRQHNCKNRQKRQWAGRRQQAAMQKQAQKLPWREGAQEN